MDGTCLDRRSRMTDVTLGALRKAAGRGIIIVPTTGRNLECIPHRLAEGTIFATGALEEEKNRGLFRYVVSSNGACVTDIKERKELFCAPVPEKDTLPLLKECGKLRLGIASHIRHRYLLQGRALTMAGQLIYGKDARGVYCVRSMEEFIRRGGHEVEEFQFYFLSPRAKQEVRSVLERYPDLRAAYTGIYVEVYSKDASKGRAIAELARHLGIRKEEIACIGDGENDLSMFEAAGLKIAMRNAVEELRKQADHVTASNVCDGAAKAVEWILKRQSMR